MYFIDFFKGFFFIIVIRFVFELYIGLGNIWIDEYISKFRNMFFMLKKFVIEI